MSPQERRNRECGDKVAYLSARTARNAALLHAWAGRAGMHAYRCGYCADWHIGHGRARGAQPLDLPVAVGA